MLSGTDGGQLRRMNADVGVLWRLNSMRWLREGQYLRLVIVVHREMYGLISCYFRIRQIRQKCHPTGETFKK